MARLTGTIHGRPFFQRTAGRNASTLDQWRNGKIRRSSTATNLYSSNGRSDNTVFNQAALDWIDEIAANLQRGYVIAIDYGLSDDDFQGNVQVRAQHRHLDSPFEQIGDADITMYVDWTSIVDVRRQMGCASPDLPINIIFLPASSPTWRRDQSCMPIAQGEARIANAASSGNAGPRLSGARACEKCRSDRAPASGVQIRA